jgi:ketosteroid isomerase-like protein
MTEELKRLNEEWNGAWLTKDVAAVETMTAEDYVYIGPQGQLLDRAAILEIIRSPSYRLARGSWTEVAISKLGADSALVLDRFRGEGEYRGQPFHEDHRHTTVWIRRHGQWQMRLEHCSPIQQ